MAAEPNRKIGIRTATVVVIAVLLFAVAMAGVWAARTFLWFGQDPAPRDYARERYELTLRTTGAQDEGQNAWPLLEETLALLTQAEQAVPQRDPADQRTRKGDSWWIEYDLALAGDAESTPAKALAELERRGVFERLSRLVNARAAVRPPAQGEDPMAELDARRPVSQGLRQLTRALAFRFVTEYRDGNEPEAAAAFRQGMALARLQSHEPLVIDRLVAMAIGSTMLTAACEEIARRRPHPETLEAMIEAIDNSSQAPLSLTLTGERLFALEMLHGTLPHSRIKMRSRGAQMEKIDEFFDLAIPLADLPRRQRIAAAPTALDAFGDRLGPMYLPASMLIPSLQKTFQAHDQWAATIAGTRLMLAVELHAARTGALPADLSELVPSPLSELPEDPFHPEGFIYRRIDPAQDPAGRGYLLYSTGPDGVDDGGKAHPKGPAQALANKEAGFDFVINPAAAPPADPR